MLARGTARRVCHTTARALSTRASSSGGGKTFGRASVAAGAFALAGGAFEWRRQGGGEALCEAAKKVTLMWGRGAGIEGSATLPKEVPSDFCGGKQVASFAFGENICVAVDADGNVWQWGSHLGPSHSKLVVKGRNVKAAAVGSERTYGLTSSGGVISWPNSDPSSLKTERVPGGWFSSSKVVSLSAFGANAAVATSEGRAYALGNGRMGQLGTGDTKDSASFVHMKLPDGEKAAQVAVGGEFCVVLTQGGRLYSCGSDTKMQLGRGRDSVREWARAEEDDAVISSSSMVRVARPKGMHEDSKAVAVAAGHEFAAAIYLPKGDDTKCLVTWGCGWMGQLGNKTLKHVSEPAVVKTLQVGKEWDDKQQKVVKLGVQQVACGAEHCLGLLDNGAVVSWGGNRDGEVGNGGKSAGIGASLLMEIQQHRVKSVFAGGRSSACLS